MKNSLIVTFLCAVVTMSACSSDTDKSTIEKLQKEVAALKEENANLRATPSAMLKEIETHVAASKVDDAKKALGALVARHPNSSEVTVGKQLINKLEEKITAERVEKERIAQLGLKAIPANPNHTWEDLKIKLSSAGTASRWVFDRYDSSYMYREAPRGEIFIVAQVTLTSKNKEPMLPGLAVYIPEGTILKKLTDLDYKFTRWMDYGTYLGNGHDFRNDFSHTATIPFSLGGLIDSNMRSKPLFVVVANQGCFSRHSERFGNPPVKYISNECSYLKSELTPEDFTSKKTSLLSVINSKMK